MRAARRRYIARRMRRAHTDPAARSATRTWHYRSEGQASKNNTVCSCGLCRATKFRDHDRRLLKVALRRE